jgi:hypothetical protein
MENKIKSTELFGVWITDADGSNGRWMSDSNNEKDRWETYSFFEAVCAAGKRKHIYNLHYDVRKIIGPNSIFT